MGKHGFTIVDMWEAREGDTTEFIYLLEWPDEDTMRSRWASFLGDEEWEEIKQASSAVHGQMVGTIHEKVMRGVSYSPDSQLVVAKGLP